MGVERLEFDRLTKAAGLLWMRDRVSLGGGFSFRTHGEDIRAIHGCAGSEGGIQSMLLSL